MPRVSEQYRADRRAEILAAAARLFAANGFHATSMADIIGEAGLSAGAVYRYFPSKEDLVAAVAETALSAADEVFAELLADNAAPSPAHAVSVLIEAISTRLMKEPETGVDFTRIGVQVWAEALRSPALAERADTVYLRLRGHCAEVARRRQQAGLLPADTDPNHVGAAMLGLVQGFVLQHLLISGTTPAAYTAGLNALLPTPPAESAATVVTLCGSTRFEAEFAEVNERLTRDGCVVLSLGLFSRSEEPGLKERLGRVHFQKIRMADEVYIVDPGGYVGESTGREIAYAESLGKPVRYLSHERR